MAYLCPFLRLSDQKPATGTGTLVIEVSDVNDNGPLVKERHVQFCSLDPVPIPLTIQDSDGPGNADPFTVQLTGDSQTNWTIITNSTSKTRTSMSMALK